MYNYYPQQQTRTATPTFALKGRPVSSLEEARALSIDFDGSVFYFPDIANKRIYTKQINIDGTASLNMYELVPTPVEPGVRDFITREEFNLAIESLKEKFAASQPKSASTPTSAISVNGKPQVSISNF